MKKVIYILVFIAFALVGVASYFLMNGHDLFKRKGENEGTEGGGTSSHNNTGSSNTSGGSSNVEQLQLNTPFKSANRLTIKTLQQELNREVLNHLQSTAIIQSISEDGVWGSETDRAVRFIYATAGLKDIEDITWDVSNMTLNNLRNVIPSAKQVLQFP